MAGDETMLTPKQLEVLSNLSRVKMTRGARGQVRYTLDEDCVNLQLTSLAARGVIKRLPWGSYKVRNPDAVVAARRRLDIPSRLSTSNVAQKATVSAG